MKTNFTKAKELFFHEEFKEALSSFSYLLKSGKIKSSDLDYFHACYYSGECNYNLFLQTRQASYLREAIENYATGLNNLWINHRLKSFLTELKINYCLKWNYFKINY